MPELLSRLLNELLKIASLQEDEVLYDWGQNQDGEWEEM